MNVEINIQGITKTKVPSPKIRLSLNRFVLIKSSIVAPTYISAKSWLRYAAPEVTEAITVKDLRFSKSNSHANRIKNATNDFGHVKNEL